MSKEPQSVVQHILLLSVFVNFIAADVDLAMPDDIHVIDTDPIARNAREGHIQIHLEEIILDEAKQ